jgi:cob(I)alamin adenosyltransferase
MSKGLIHIYTGDGKGKTTASIGLAVRAAGHGKKVLILQFLKSRRRNLGENILARIPNIKITRFQRQTTPLFDKRVNLSKLRKSIKKAIKTSMDEIKSGQYDMVIMDELNTLLSNRLAVIEDVRELIRAKPKTLELVLTGRGAPQELLDIADYVTEMKMIKHPYKKGVKARKGIEY